MNLSMSSIDEINNILKHSNYYDNKTLINNPQPLPNQTEPKCIMLQKFINYTTHPQFSIVIPVHNQEKLIVHNLKSIIYNTSNLFEIIIIFDSCTDDSINQVKNYIQSLSTNIHTKLSQIILIEQTSPIFETSCDNIGFRLSSGRFCLEIQADMEMIQFGYNEQLAKPFNLFPNKFIAISGRCAHSQINTNSIGKFGPKIEENLNIPLKFLNGVFINETCNRGPLLIDREKLQQLGYLDEQNFWLGDDDHDLMARAAIHNLLCGYVPIEFFSPILNGTTRKERSPENQLVYDLRKERSNGSHILSMAKMKSPSIKPQWIPFII